MRRWKMSYKRPPTPFWGGLLLNWVGTCINSGSKSGNPLKSPLHPFRGTKQETA